jgi:TolB-like protein/Tfp pilus assembly protein PilF
MNSSATPLLKRTWRELRRRKVVRVAISYALIAWVVLQVAGVIFPPLHVPDWVMTWLVLAAILGFPIALLMAWWFERTPAGFVQDQRSVASKGIRWIFGIGVAVLTVAALAWWLTRVYGVSQDDAPLDMVSDSRGVIADNSIAVMPFADMSAEKDQQHLSDGLAEQLLDRLARVNGLNVSSRTSAFALRDSKKGVQELGQLLGAAYLVEGSVRKADGKLRVTAQLIDTRNGYHMWTDTYERENKDIFGVQDQITAAIAAELSKRISSIDKKSALSSSALMTTQDSAALELYMKGRAAWRLRTPGKLKQAVEFFQQAIAKDPKFAQAHAGLSDSYLMLQSYGSMPLDEALKKAEGPAIEAITLAPESGEAWASLGLLRMTARQYRSAETSLKEAINRDARYEMAQLWLSRTYGSMGKLRDQQAILAEAVALNPLEPVIAINAAEAALNMGNDTEALRIVERLLAVTPNSDMLLRTMSGIYYHQKKLDTALGYAYKAYQAEPDNPNNISVLMQLLVELNRQEDAKKLLLHFNNEAYNANFEQIIRVKQGDISLTPRWQKTIDGCIKAKRVDSDTINMLGLIVPVLIADKKHDQAVELLQLVLADEESLPNRDSAINLTSMYVVALRQSGKQADAKLWQERMNVLAKEWLEQGWGGPRRELLQATIAATNGDKELAITSLLAAYEKGFVETWPLPNDPRFGNLMTDARMQALQKRSIAHIQRMQDASAEQTIELSVATKAIVEK